MQDQIDTAADFTAWLKEMGWHKRGGRTLAAEALGKSTEALRTYSSGEVVVPLETRLAMTALAQGLKPWTTKDHGLPALYASVSLGKSRR